MSEMVKRNTERKGNSVLKGFVDMRCQVSPDLPQDLYVRNKVVFYVFKAIVIWGLCFSHRNLILTDMGENPL